MTLLLPQESFRKRYVARLKHFGEISLQIIDIGLEMRIDKKTIKLSSTSDDGHRREKLRHSWHGSD